MPIEIHTIGILIIERDTANIWKNLDIDIRNKILSYRGFSGIHWPFFDEWKRENKNKEVFNLYNGTARLSDLDRIVDYYKWVKNRTTEIVDLLAISFTDTILDFSFKNFKFIGYDIGVIDEYEEPIYFSAILNEIRVNGNSNFKDVERKLNGKYLFDNKEDCFEYLNAREKAFKEGETIYIETAYETNQYIVLPVFLYIKI